MFRMVLLPVFLFVTSALLAVMSLHAAWLSLIVGVALCAYTLVQSRRAAVQTPGPQVLKTGSATLRAGIALVAAPVLTVLFALAAMSGLFGRH